MVKKRLGCKWSGFWMWSEIQKPNHLKSTQMAAILSKTIWNLDKNIRISYVSGFQIPTVHVSFFLVDWLRDSLCWEPSCSGKFANFGITQPHTLQGQPSVDCGKYADGSTSSRIRFSYSGWYNQVIWRDRLVTCQCRGGQCRRTQCYNFDLPPRRKRYWPPSDNLLGEKNWPPSSKGPFLANSC